MELMNSLDLVPPFPPIFFLCRSLRSFFLTVIRIFRSPRGVLTADKFVILPAERMEGRRKRDSLLLLLRPSWIEMRDEDHYDEIFPLSDLSSGWGRERSTWESLDAEKMRGDHFSSLLLSRSLARCLLLPSLLFMDFSWKEGVEN